MVGRAPRLGRASSSCAGSEHFFGFSPLQAYHVGSNVWIPVLEVGHGTTVDGSKRKTTQWHRGVVEVGRPGGLLGAECCHAAPGGADAGRPRRRWYAMWIGHGFALVHVPAF